MSISIKVHATINCTEIRCELLRAFKSGVTDHSYAIVFSPILDPENSLETLIPLLFDPDLPKQTARFISNEEDKAVIEDFEKLINKEKCIINYTPIDEITFQIEIEQNQDEEHAPFFEGIKKNLSSPKDIDDAIKQIDQKIVELLWEEVASEANQGSCSNGRICIANCFIKKVLSNNIALTNILVEDIVEVPPSLKDLTTHEDNALLKSFSHLIQALGKSSVVKQDVTNSLDEIVKCTQCTKELYLGIISHKTISELFPSDDRQEIHNSIVLRQASFFNSKEIKTAANYYYNRKEYLEAVSLFQVLEKLYESSSNVKELVETLNSQGCCFVELLEFEKAYSAFNKALCANSDYAPVYNNIAYTLMIECETLSSKQSIRKKLHEALANINDAIQRSPDDISFISNRAYIEYKLGDYSRVLKALDRARTLSLKYSDYSTILKLSIDARIKMAISEL